MAAIIAKSKPEVPTSASSRRGKSLSSQLQYLLVRKDAPDVQDACERSLKWVDGKVRRLAKAAARPASPSDGVLRSQHQPSK